MIPPMIIMSKAMIFAAVKIFWTLTAAPTEKQFMPVSTTNKQVANSFFTNGGGPQASNIGTVNKESQWETIMFDIYETS